MARKKRSKLMDGLAKSSGIGFTGMSEDDQNTLLDPLGWKQNLSANSDEEDAAADDWRKKALAEAEGLKAPTLGELNLDEYSWLGDYKPTDKVDARSIDAFNGLRYDDIDSILQGPSAFEDVSTDPRLRAKQMDSLDALDEIIAGGGLTAADRANLTRSQNQTAQADRGRREAILADQRARGMGGSGMELLAMLDSSQAATDRQAQEGLDIMGMAEQRALDAILSSGQLAGNVRGQDFGEEARIAEARDAIEQFNTGNLNDNARFNAGNRLDTGRYNLDAGRDAAKFNAGMAFDADRINTGYANDASRASWEGRQGNADRNVGVRNTERDYNQTQLPQRNFDNDASVRSIKSNAYGNEANYWTNKANAIQARKAETQGGIMRIAGTIGGGMIGGPAGAKAGGAIAPEPGYQYGSTGYGSSINDGDENDNWTGGGGQKRAYQRQQRGG